MSVITTPINHLTYHVAALNVKNIVSREFREALIWKLIIWTGLEQQQIIVFSHGWNTIKDKSIYSWLFLFPHSFSLKMGMFLNISYIILSNLLYNNFLCILKNLQIKNR